MATLRERLRFLFTGRPPAPPSELHGRAIRIDAAQTTAENRKHWANADHLGPNAAFDPATCARLRSRSRYETLNNSHLKSLVKTCAYDLIGTCPRPEFMFPRDDDGKLAKAVEKRFARWCKDNLMGLNLRVMLKAVVRDGGAFGILDTDDDSPNAVKLTVRIAEAEQCATPPQFLGDPYVHQGKRVNRVGRPTEYYFLRYHPGENLFPTAGLAEYETIPAKFVFHLYERERAGAQNGIPQTTPALPVFSQLRRYSLATLSAAEFAAMIAGVLKTNMPPGSAATIDDWHMVELVRGALMAAPEGWEPYQMKAEQPTTNFPDFERAKLGEAGRSVSAPINLTTGDSSRSNFASGKLDLISWTRNAWIDRFDLEQIIWDPIVNAWAQEAVLIAGHLPDGLPPVDEWEWSTNWDGFAELDETKTSAADDQRLRNGTTNLATIAAERFGSKWRDVIDQLAVEIAYCKSKGVRHPMEGPSPPVAPPAAEGDPDDDEEEDDETPLEDKPERNGHHRTLRRRR